MWLGGTIVLGGAFPVRTRQRISALVPSEDHYQPEPIRNHVLYADGPSWLHVLVGISARCAMSVRLWRHAGSGRGRGALLVFRRHRLDRDFLDRVPLDFPMTTRNFADRRGIGSHRWWSAARSGGRLFRLLRRRGTASIEACVYFPQRRAAAPASSSLAHRHARRRYLFSAHVVQHFLLALIIPPLWLLGTPRSLAEAALRRPANPPHRASPRAATCSPGRSASAR